MLTIAANGLRFACLAEGPEDGPLALLFHGFPDTAHTWSDLLPRLAARGLRAVAPFLRGYHPTSIPADGDYSALALGRDVLGLIEALGRAQATVIGHDWGAYASYAAANLAPERVTRLVTAAIPHPRAGRRAAAPEASSTTTTRAGGGRSVTTSSSSCCCVRSIMPCTTKGAC